MASDDRVMNQRRWLRAHKEDDPSCLAAAASKNHWLLLRATAVNQHISAWTHTGRRRILTWQLCFFSQVFFLLLGMCIQRYMIIQSHIFIKDQLHVSCFHSLCPPLSCHHSCTAWASYTYLMLQYYSYSIKVHLKSNQPALQCCCLLLSAPLLFYSSNRSRSPS